MTSIILTITITAMIGITATYLCCHFHHGGCCYITISTILITDHEYAIAHGLRKRDRMLTSILSEVSVPVV